MVYLAEEFTLAPIRRLFKKRSGLRISEGAAEELRRLLGEYGSSLAEVSISIASGDGRKTVLERDVIAAKDRLHSGGA